MKKGLDEMQSWLEDLISSGLSTLEAREGELYEMAGRMVDSQNGGIARRLRVLGDALNEGNWVERAEREIADIFLLCRAMQKIELLEPLRQYDLLSQCGMIFRKTSFRDFPRFRQKVAVLALRSEKQEQLTAFRYWLWMPAVKKFGLYLEFVFGNAKRPFSLCPGNVYDSTFFFYPSAYPLRTGIESAERTADLPATMAYASWKAMTRYIQAALGANPWLPQIPLALKPATAMPTEKGLRLFDKDGLQLDVSIQSSELCAAALLVPCVLFGEWQNGQFHILSFFSEGRFNSL